MGRLFHLSVPQWESSAGKQRQKYYLPDKVAKNIKQENAYKVLRIVPGTQEASHKYLKNYFIIATTI